MWILGFLMGIGTLAALGLFAGGGVIAARHVASKWHSLDKRQRRRCTALFLAFAILVLGIANGIAFFTVATAIGGNADRVEGGRYFVSSHGRLTEVSQAVWTYSDFHGRITWFTSLMAAFASAVIMYLNWLVERGRPSLKITIARDGAILINDQPASIEEVIERAELAKARREPIYLKHDYPPDAVPTEAVRLHHEFIGHEILFQAIDGPREECT
jgi:hypothetical protein